MKRRGFTLIELLAVIVVLAIIALIATPVVMNTIKSAQKGAAERSAERYLEAVETAIVKNKLNNETIADGSYQIVDGQLQGTALDIEIKGDYPKSGTIKIEKGKVVSNGTSLMIGEYTITMDENGKAAATEQVVVKDEEYYGITYFTRNNYGEDPATDFIKISESKAPDGFYENYPDINMSNEVADAWVEQYREYLTEIGNFVFDKYSVYGFYLDYGEYYTNAIYINKESNGVWTISPKSCYC